MSELMDVAAERAVLAGIFNHGSNSYYDTADILSESTFTLLDNQAIYRCFRHIYGKSEEHDVKVDFALLQSAANDTGVAHYFKKKDGIDHVKALMEFRVNEKNVRKFAGKIRKLEIGRILKAQLFQAGNSLDTLTGDETVNHILGVAENVIFDFSSLINDGMDEAPKRLTDGLLDYVTYLADNPVTQIGVPTGFPLYDASIGGGLRRGAVSMIGARTKAGKSVFAINAGKFIAKSGIPVLYLDTEMMENDQRHRLVAHLSEVDINLIETGQFGQNEQTKKKVFNTISEVDTGKLALFHKNISGYGFEEILSVMRRWLIQEVGINDDGSAKECVIIYDYLKLMSAEGVGADMKEYQLLGFMMTGLHNFAVRYKVPILSFIQLNRDGITKESTDAASGSDRIVWLCSNFSIYKRKSDEEIAQDGAECGNRKMVPIITRHGKEPDGGYINMNMIGEWAKIVETSTGRSNEPIETEIDDDTEVPFGN